MELRTIQVWCEYDMNGQFGGNNNEEVFTVDATFSDDEVDALVLKVVSRDTGESEEELDGLYGWSDITLEQLGI